MPMKHRPAFLALTLLAALAAGCGGAHRSGFSSEQGYGLDPPPGWEVSTAARPMLDVVVRAPADGDFHPNLNVTVVGANGNPDEALRQIRQLYPSVFQDYRLISHSPVSVEGAKALDISGTYSAAGTGKRLWLRQLVAFHGGKTYTFSCTAPDATKDRTAAAFEKTLASIRWQ